MSNLNYQLRWYTAIRVVAVVSVLVPYFLLQIGPGTTDAEGNTPLPSTVIYLLAGLMFGATLIYIALMRTLRRHPTVQAYIQFFGDLLLITLMVYYLGGIESPFSMLYLIVIAVASTLLGRQAGFSVASGANVCYATLVLGLYFHVIPTLPGAPEPEAVSVFRLCYNLAIHCFGFYAVAFLTSVLARNVARVERALVEKSEHLADLKVVHRDVIQSISSGLITTDLDGLVTSLNLAGVGILSLLEEDMLGKSILDSGLFSAERWEELTEASQGQRTLRAETELERDGVTQYVGFSISQLTEAGGSHRGYIVIFQDFTRYRQLEDELRIKDRMAAVGELAAGLAHEIGNPLAAISGSVQMLSSSPDATPSQRKLTEILLKESQRLDRTIKGFLRFARPRERSNSPFDIARLLAENCELLRNSAEVSKHHQIEIHLEPPSAPVIADPDQVSQIFWNLARNALRAMPDGGELTVVGRLDEDFYRMQVIDTGRGMTEEQRANLFHPFRSFFDGGTGIGMAIVYRIVQEHGGHLLVDTRPGGGTAITVELPAGHPTQHSPASPASRASRAIPAGEAP